MVSVQKEVEKQRPLIEKFFSEIKVGEAGQLGVTRDTYGEGENVAHGVFARLSKEVGFDVDSDFAANTFATLKGKERSQPRILIGSHLDSVKQGGNFDGAAGVIAGLASIAALRSAGVEALCDITVMGVRAEESAWFQVSYIGSRSALGVLPEDALEARRIDTNRKLEAHLIECGGTPNAIRAGRRSIDPSTVRAFLEVHIEQAPSLVDAEVPLAICTGIPGNFRYRNVTVRGEQGHVGLPRRFRRDAAMAAVEFASRLDALWEEYENMNRPMAFTFGRFHTNSDQHGLTIVPGIFHFSLDVRAYDEHHLDEVEARLQDMVRQIERERGVTFDLGPRASAPVAKTDPEICAALERSARALSVPTMALGSPGSHDAAAFAESGVPIGMLLIRNENGSHNPAEAMDIDDFIKAVSVLTLWLASTVCAQTGR